MGRRLGGGTKHVTDARADVAQIILAGKRTMEASALPGATSRVAVMQIVTAVGVINGRIHCGGHFQHREAGRVVAGGASCRPRLLAQFGLTL